MHCRITPISCCSFPDMQPKSYFEDKIVREGWSITSPLFVFFIQGSNSLFFSAQTTNNIRLKKGTSRLKKIFPFIFDLIPGDTKLNARTSGLLSYEIVAQDGTVQTLLVIWKAPQIKPNQFRVWVSTWSATLQVCGNKQIIAFSRILCGHGE